MSMQRVILSGVIVLVASVGAAQEPKREQQLRNLQFFPKSTTLDEIVPPMREISQALGAQNCEFCHVSGRGELDDKVQKRTARAMLHLVADLNAKLDAELGPAPAGTQRVQCVTCHRGVPVPAQLNDIVAQAADREGMLRRSQSIENCGCSTSAARAMTSVPPVSSLWRGA